MIATLIRLTHTYRWLTLLVAAAIMASGVYAFRQLPIDAYPDISAQTVSIVTTFPGRAPEEVDRQVTIPIEIAMRNVPRVDVVRSRAIFGLSLIQLVFEEGVDPYWARQRVLEKLNQVDLPDGVKPDLGPLAGSCGEIYRYELVSDGTQDLMDLRTLNDWVVIPRMLRAAGVVDVANFGGLAKQYTVTFLPLKLQQYGLMLSDVVDALKGNNNAAGGSVLPRGSMSFIISARGVLETTGQIEKTFVKSVNGTPVYLKDIAEVSFEPQTPASMYGKNTTDESVEGIVLMRRGENPSQVLIKVKEAAKELNTALLPDGVKLVPFYDRQDLVDNTLHTVAHSTTMGITLVVLTLLLFLGRPSMALLVAITVPFALLFALVVMWITGIPIGLLSVGAIDFGVIVDGAIIVAENIAHRLGAASHRGEKVNIPRAVLTATLEVDRAVFFSILIIVVAYLPLLSLVSIEGLLFRPMALTMVYALGGAAFFALFVVPAVATIVFRNGYHEWENPLLSVMRPIYAFILRRLIALRWLTVAACTIGLLWVGFRIVPKLGFEFLPYMDEGAMWVRANFPEGTSLQQTSEFAKRFREICAEFPDIEYASTQSGRNDSGTDPYPPSRLEVMIGPKHQSQWKDFHSKHDLIVALSDRMRDEFPTTRFNFTQPMIDNVLEDTNGTSASLAVEFSGPDPEVLLSLSRRTVELLKSIEGARDVAIEQEGPQPQLVVRPDRALCARYNVKMEDVTKLINTALGGEPVGTIYEGEKKFNIAVKLDRREFTSPQSVSSLPVYNSDGRMVPLGAVAKIEVVDGQTMIARENSRRRLTVRCDIYGRDQGGFAAEAKEKYEREIKADVPSDYKVEWLGMFQNLERAQEHFQKLIPITVVLIYIMLWLTFGSQRAALLVLLAVPFACVGGVLALYFRGMHLNMSSAVGFTALFGIAIMDGVLMVRWITTLRIQGIPMEDAIIRGALERLRPILMTAIVAILGLLPASMATGLGSDVQRPLATVIVWGLFSSTVLTLFVVPVGYRIFAPPLPEERSAKTDFSSEFVEPLPYVSATDVIGLLEYLASHDGEVEVFRIADETNREFSRVISIVKAAEMLDFADTPGQIVRLTSRGRAFIGQSPADRQTTWRDQLLTLRLFREIFDVVNRQPEKSIDREFVLETIVTRMPHENYEKMFNTFVIWSRFGNLFSYDEATQRISLGQ
jgi:cobalt-zinc-cadmium resistance protein CzcA